MIPFFSICNWLLYSLFKNNDYAFINVLCTRLYCIIRDFKLNISNFLFTLKVADVIYCAILRGMRASAAGRWPTLTVSRALDSHVTEYAAAIGQLWPNSARAPAVVDVLALVQGIVFCRVVLSRNFVLLGKESVGRVTSRCRHVGTKLPEYVIERCWFRFAVQYETNDTGTQTGV